MDTEKEITLDTITDTAKLIGYRQGLGESMDIIQNTSGGFENQEGIIAIIEFLRIKFDEGVIPPISKT